MAIVLTCLEAGAIAGVEQGLASICDEHDRAPDDIDELVFVSVPMALTGPGARAQLQQIDAELGKPGGHPQPTPGLVLAGFVERLGIARSGARSGANNIDLHVPISRSPVPRSIAGAGRLAPPREPAPAGSLTAVSSFVPHNGARKPI